MISEAELIEGCKANKRDLQKALYQRYAAKMFSVCLRYTKNREEAEDVLQDAFVKVFTRIDQYSGSGAFEGWIRRIMVNTALEALRSKRIDYSSKEIETVADDEAVDPEALTRIAMQDLMQHIRGLPAGCQVVFNLYVIEGYNHREIAEMLNVTAGTSKSQLARARNLLQEKLKNVYEQKIVIK
ncbi:MAG: RNA polymerase sigma factor [Bacteroidia bacterium]